jgi:hypothetical protein
MSKTARNVCKSMFILLESELHFSFLVEGDKILVMYLVFCGAYHPLEACRDRREIWGEGATSGMYVAKGLSKDD